MAANDYYAMKARGPKTSGWCFPTRPLTDHAQCIPATGGCACTKQGCPCNPVSAVSTSTPEAADQAAGEALPVPCSAVEAAPSQVTEPCVIDELDELIYHAPWTVPVELGGSLSNSGAKVLLTQTPAHFHWQRENGRANKRAFDIGHAIHSRVLGVGAEVVRIDADSYRTNAAKDARDAAYAAGKVPLLADEVDEVGLMAEAVLKHPLAKVLFEAETIREQSVFWQDSATGAFLRCRPDSRAILPSGRTLCVDLKSTDSADPISFGKSAANFGYYVQHPWYLAGLRAHDLAEADSSFLFVAVEKAAPYLVNVIELHADDVRRGQQAMRRAIDLYAECQGNDDWPGYSTTVQPVELPYWFAKQHDERYVN